MRKILNVILVALIFTFLSTVSKGQSSEMVYDLVTEINVTSGADICADVITINGTYSGSGTKCNGPLPVELTSFTASVVDNSVHLNWQTATEVNNYGFEIERSFVGSQFTEWEAIGFVEGHGNSNSPKEYTFVDDLTDVKADSLEYRLKQIDTDGNFQYYGTTAEVGLANITGINNENIPTEFALMQNFPNPFNPSTTISYQIPTDNFVTLKIFDVLGREAAILINTNQTAGSYKVTFYATNLPSGVYFYKIEAGSFHQIKKLMLIK